MYRSESHGPDAPLHVALVSTQRRWHGGESQAALLAAGLRDRGHRCSILARQDGEFCSRLRGQGFEVLPFPGRGPRAIWRLRLALQKLRPHVVHANDSHALTAAGLAGLGLRLPLRVAARRVDFQLRSTWQYRNLADGVVCVSTAVRRICQAAGLPAERLHVVHDGVSPAFAASGERPRGRSSLGLADDQPLLLTVAKLTDHKGHAFLMRALPTIVARFPRVVLALAGDGELRGELASLAAQLDLERHVRFLGYRHDVPDLLAAADVVVQPSHMEGLCSSLIDAMLAARPIVATTAGGIPDLLSSPDEQERVAWLVPPRSPAALAAAVVAVLADPSAAAVCGTAARDRALRCFTADVMVAKTLAAYARIGTQLYGDQAASRLPAWEASRVDAAPDRSAA